MKSVNTFWCRLLVLVGFWVIAVSAAADDEATSVPVARELVEATLQQWRGDTSQSTLRMIVTRPDWQREMAVRVWTAGHDKSLVRVLAPERDAGAGSLLMDGAMWSFSPKVSRVVRVPGSMMSQQWMGSDFSNNEISRSDSILQDYSHKLVGESMEGDHRIFRLELTPHEHSPVVWGHVELDIRDDFILMRQAFFDQQGELVKEMKTNEVVFMGGRMVAARQRMESSDQPGEWTEIIIEEAEFDMEISPRLFSVASLRNPRL
ncbi:outer membrane lipoprotein-sorting protein [Vreelandella titanicae]|uniref:outer membrane lipoprotein-sorting protein n=1 Tax=Vreelandella titanicae TaxID=664683 RepID=UPI00241C49AF|nr:outer membrane lipoprotein-sorting protein [Halomonas titanicae]UEQ05314.1 outer membrane lipoprotein-sorting protein [Halomonas profundus]